MRRPLHTAEHPWKPMRLEATAEGNDVKPLLPQVRALLNKLTPASYNTLIPEFIALDVCKSPALDQVVSMIFSKAVDESKFCGLYAKLCVDQVKKEIENTNNVSIFRNAILSLAQDFYAEAKPVEIDAVAYPEMQRQRQYTLFEAHNAFRKRKFDNIMFIGHIYLNSLISVRIIIFCIADLLKSVTERPENLNAYKADDASVECAIGLIELIGRKLQILNNEEKAKRAEEIRERMILLQQVALNDYMDDETRFNDRIAELTNKPSGLLFPLDLTFQTLMEAKQLVSSRIRFKIIGLEELRARGWVPKQPADTILDDIKYDIELEQMKMAYIRVVKHDRAMIDAEAAPANAPNEIERGEAKLEDALMAMRIDTMDKGCDECDDKVQHWKNKCEGTEKKYEELEKKYRKLLMMLGKEKKADN